MTGKELWGTFSVGDHLRRRAFIADVLLYDRLVIPVPPENDVDEYERWRKMGWRPDLQQQKLKILERDSDRKAIKVPWTYANRERWEKEYLEAKAKSKGRADPGLHRTSMAEEVSRDVESIKKKREAFDWEDFKNRGGRPEEINELAHFTTRSVLVDYSNMTEDTQRFMTMPLVEVSAVPAYGSYQAFQQDFHLEKVTDAMDHQIQKMDILGWQFLVPEDPGHSDDELLKRAIEIAQLEEVKKHRQLFHLWQAGEVLKRRSSKEIKEELEEVIRNYEDKLKKKKINTIFKYAFAVGGIALGAVSLAVSLPVLGPAGVFMELGSFYISEKEKPIPENLAFAAMFHDARRHFGWRKRK